MAWDAASLTIGIFIGIIIILIIVWITYVTRTFLFSYCPTSHPVCVGSDYYNDPGDAIAAGASVQDILFLNDVPEMFYKRVPNTSVCVPSSDQVVEIEQPQYCLFTIDAQQFEGKNQFFGSTSYTVPVGELPIFVETVMNCTPAEGSVASSGVPILKWDAN